MRLRILPFPLALIGLLASCGGSKTPVGPSGTPTPTATPTAAATATPAAAATPTPDPRGTLPDGPVATMTVKLRPVDRCRFCNEFRDAEQDNGVWIVWEGEFIVFDSDQRNAKAEKCRWINDPVWDLDDPGDVLYIRDSSQPFLFRADAAKAGTTTVWAVIDDVKSNVLSIRVKPGQRPAGVGWRRSSQ